MPTNLALDDKLLSEALRIGGQRTKRSGQPGEHPPSSGQQAPADTARRHRTR